MSGAAWVQPTSGQNDQQTQTNGVPLSGYETNAPIIEDIGGAFFIAHSRAMREIRALVELVAEADVPVLIVGETGTGKEVVVRLIHARSSRRNRPLLKVNCAALPAELLESELFGYEAGAFTGANAPRTGKFEACHKGTILLDEIAEMPPGPQAKLLRVLQDGEFYRLGSPTPIHVDVRVLAATNVDIINALKANKLREDLYYRLNAFTIQIPPLRERKEDIPILFRHFMKDQSERLGCEPLPVSPSLLQACLRYSWPGNVRELENFVKRHLVIRNEESAAKQLLPEKSSGYCRTEAASVSFSMKATDLKSLVRGLKQQAERQAILAALQLTNGNRKEAAQRLNISSRALLYKMHEYRIIVTKGHGESPAASS
jgi:two-component system, NtrC family, response regulator AtoC